MSQNWNYISIHGKKKTTKLENRISKCKQKYHSKVKFNNKSQNNDVTSTFFHQTYGIYSNYKTMIGIREPKLCNLISNG